MKSPLTPKVLLTTLLCALTAMGIRVRAQNQGNNWYFGNYAALTFNTTPPSPVAGCAMWQREGNASISDAAGNLLFYTDGVTVWDGANNTMPNGTGLQGEVISAQSAVVAPLPQSNTQYYVFTVPDWQNPGPQAALRYSIVDMTLNGGMGDVTTQNVLINANVREQITAVQHCNRRDIWIITHEKGGNRYVAYLLTPAGLNMTPVISDVGLMPYTGNNRFGYLKSSTDGTRLCSTLGGQTGNNIELTSFDKSTGLVSNPITFATGSATQYSSEFSPDNSKLYSVNLQNPPLILQYDITGGMAAAIEASLTAIGQGGALKSCLQIGPDGKIYVSKDLTSFLGVINQPNLAGAACNYIDNAINMTGIGGQGRLGFPNFVQSFFRQPFNLGSDTTLCAGNTLTLTATTPDATYLWQDGSTDSTFLATATGTYWVHIFLPCDTLRDTIQVTMDPSQQTFDLGNDTGICAGNTVLLDATVPGATYLWQNGSSDSTLTASTPGTYWVQVTATGCGTGSDTIHITVGSSSAILNLGNDSSICPGSTLVLDASTTGATYLWQDGSTNATYTVSNSGMYWVQAALSCDTLRDTIQVAVGIPPPAIDLGNDTGLCSGNVLLLDATIPGGTYLWQNGATSPTLTVSSGGLYWVRVFLPCDTLTDSIQIHTHAPITDLDLPDSLFLCPGQSQTLTAHSPTNAYVWSGGQTTASITVSDTGTYRVSTVDSCGQTISDSCIVAYVAAPGPLSQTITVADCQQVKVMLDAFPANNYLWNTGQTTASITVVEAGTYSVSFELCDSVFTQTFTITAPGNVPPDNLFFPNTFTPNGDHVNDRFRLVGNFGNMEAFGVWIYNRWGNLIYSSSDPQFEWDGSFMNKPVSDGVYYFIGHYEDHCTGQNDLKGHVTVVR